MPKLRAADLLTYCDHCGFSLVGEYDDHANCTILRCPTSNAVQQVIPAADTTEWSEWALEQLYRMCKNR